MQSKIINGIALLRAIYSLRRGPNTTIVVILLITMIHAGKAQKTYADKANKQDGCE